MHAFSTKKSAIQKNHKLKAILMCHTLQYGHLFDDEEQ